MPAPLDESQTAIRAHAGDQLDIRFGMDLDHEGLRATGSV